MGEEEDSEDLFFDLCCFLVFLESLNLSHGVMSSSLTSMDLKRLGVNVTFLVVPDLIRSSKSMLAVV